MALHRLAMLMAFAPLLLFSSAERASTAPPVRLDAEALTGGADVTLASQNAAAPQATVQRDDREYPFYMPMQGLRKPVNDLPRGAQVDDIVYTIALTAIQAANRPMDV